MAAEIAVGAAEGDAEPNRVRRVHLAANANARAGLENDRRMVRARDGHGDGVNGALLFIERGGDGVGHRLQVCGLSCTGGSPVALRALGAALKVAGPLADIVRQLLRLQFAVQRGHHLMLGGHVNRLAVAQARGAHAAFADGERRRGRPGVHAEARAEHLERRRARLDEHRFVFRLRADIGREAAFLEAQFFLAIIGKCEHGVAGDHHG